MDEPVDYGAVALREEKSFFGPRRMKRESPWKLRFTFRPTLRTPWRQSCRHPISNAIFLRAFGGGRQDLLLGFRREVLADPAKSVELLCVIG
jgi:hypothetical protein